MSVFSQAALARELGTSEMSAHRVLKTLGRAGKPLSDIDVLSVLIVGEMQDLDVKAYRAAEILADLSAEIRHVATAPERRCWIVFVETAERNFQLAPTSRAHLESILDAFPLSIVLPLHRLAASAAERLAGMKARISLKVAA